MNPFELSVDPPNLEKHFQGSSVPVTFIGGSWGVTLAVAFAILPHNFGQATGPMNDMSVCECSLSSQYIKRSWGNLNFYYNNCMCLSFLHSEVV